MAGTRLKVSPAPGGWLHADWGNGKAWVRFDLDEHNKLTRITEVRVLDPTPDSLRRIPLARIQNAATARGAGLVQVMLAVGFNQEPPPEMFRAFSSEVIDDPRRYRLKRPAGRKLDDAFFANVARAYRDAVTRGLNPRQTLSADTGSAPDTVAGWIGDARKRGHLPPASPGKVSA